MKQINLNPTRTYANEKNARKAITDWFGENLAEVHPNLRWIMVMKEGRYFPVFVGESAVQAGVHFKFCVIG